MIRVNSRLTILLCTNSIFDFDTKSILILYSPNYNVLKIAASPTPHTLLILPRAKTVTRKSTDITGLLDVITRIPARTEPIARRSRRPFM